MSHLHKLMSIPRVLNNLVHDLKRLRDDTNETLQALDNLKRPVHEWNDLMVYLTAQKLDKSLQDWEMLLGSRTDVLTYTELDRFIEARIRSCEAVQLTNNVNTFDKPTASSRFGKSAHAHSISSYTQCPLCKDKHSLVRCEKFKSLDVARRKETARGLHCCFNWLIPGHLPKACKSGYNCFKCHQRHNTLLHPEPSPSGCTNTAKPSPDDASASETAPSSGTNATVHHSQRRNEATGLTYLATAIVRVRTTNGREQCVRALIDQGSDSTFIKASLVQSLRVKQHPATNVRGMDKILYRSRSLLCECNHIFRLWNGIDCCRSTRFTSTLLLRGEERG